MWCFIILTASIQQVVTSCSLVVRAEVRSEAVVGICGYSTALPRAGLVADLTP